MAESSCPHLAVSIGTQHFSLPLDCLQRHPNSTLSCWHTRQDQFPQNEPFERDPALFAACVIPFLTTGIIPVPSGVPVSTVAAEFDFWCLEFSEEQLHFQSLKEGLEFRFGQFVHHCYITAVRPLLERLMVPPFRTAISGQRVDWQYHGRALGRDVIRRILWHLQAHPYCLSVTPPETGASMDVTACLISYSFPEVGPHGSEAEALHQQLTCRIQEWFQCQVKGPFKSRDPRDKDLLNFRMSLGIARPQDPEPVLAVALHQPQYGFLATISCTITMYSLPAEWTLQLNIPPDPPPNSEAADLWQWVRDQADAEAARVVTELHQWTDFCTMPTFIYFNACIAQTVHDHLKEVHGLDVVLQGSRTVVVNVGLEATLYPAPDAPSTPFLCADGSSDGAEEEQSLASESGRSLENSDEDGQGILCCPDDQSSHTAASDSRSLTYSSAESSLKALQQFQNSGSQSDTWNREPCATDSLLSATSTISDLAIDKCSGKYTGSSDEECKGLLDSAELDPEGGSTGLETLSCWLGPEDPCDMVPGDLYAPMSPPLSRSGSFPPSLGKPVSPPLSDGWPWEWSSGADLLNLAPGPASLVRSHSLSSSKSW